MMAAAAAAWDSPQAAAAASKIPLRRQRRRRSNPAPWKRRPSPFLGIPSGLARKEGRKAGGDDDGEGRAREELRRKGYFLLLLLALALELFLEKSSLERGILYAFPKEDINEAFIQRSSGVFIVDDLTVKTRLDRKTTYQHSTAFGVSSRFMLCI
ncbi:Hypothetical predicted protein [Podarcis lilfordi]|uniref:Uncharacterized protein n=1 Tax=Podarcis lilfordi TaxID=74358 RepID=A0AA35P871_9SAUR|nr:Hypothetical predicted protein [Podarcis lilfordi]